MATTGALFFIVLGAFVFGYFVVQTRIPATLGDWITGMGLGPVAVIALLVLVYLALGCVLDSISMMLITVPVFLPIAETMGFSPVWFGIFIVIVAEIGLITPPVGMVMFVVIGLTEISIERFTRAVLPLLGALVLVLLLVTYVPAVVLFLPDLIMGPG